MSQDRIPNEWRGGASRKMKTKKKTEQNSQSMLIFITETSLILY